MVGGKYQHARKLHCMIEDTFTFILQIKLLGVKVSQNSNLY
jgi:hypothetical protein